MEDNIVYLCEHCIGAIHSRGEKIMVGECVESDDDKVKCYWCEEYFDPDELKECLF